MTDRRVNVTLSIPTTEDAHQVMAGVLDAIRNRLPDLPVESASVHAFDLDDDAEPPTVCLTVDPASGAVQGHADGDRAHEYATNVGAVVVELPISGDYRRERTDV